MMPTPFSPEKSLAYADGRTLAPLDRMKTWATMGDEYFKCLWNPGMWQERRRRAVLRQLAEFYLCPTFQMPGLFRIDHAMASSALKTRIDILPT
jgi:hypothetical protein